jgi:hypothetical protein
MIPSSIQRGRVGRGGISPLVLVVGAVAAIVVLLAVWVLATMDSEPTLTPVNADVAVKI